MTYTEEEKRRIEALLAIFQDAIRSQSFFDIVYSEKAGYLLFQADSPNPGPLLPIDEGRDLLWLLLSNLALEEDEFSPGTYHIVARAFCAAADRERTAHWFSSMINRLEREEDREYYLAALDENLNLLP